MDGGKLPEKGEPQYNIEQKGKIGWLWNAHLNRSPEDNLYVLGDDALISEGSFMQTKYLCIMIHI